MRIREYACLPLLLLLLTLCGCTLSVLPLPTAEELLSYETRNVCIGFSVTDTNGTPPVTGVLQRDTSGDSITVDGAYSRTVFRFSGDTVCLQTDSDGTGEALSLPLSVPADRGVRLWHSLFSLTPDNAEVSQTDGGYLLRKDNIVIRFSADTIPQSVTCTTDTGTVTVAITYYAVQ